MQDTDYCVVLRVRGDNLVPGSHQADAIEQGAGERVVETYLRGVTARNPHVEILSVHEASA
jgi:hypothetical protein